MLSKFVESFFLKASYRLCDYFLFTIKKVLDLDYLLKINLIWFDFEKLQLRMKNYKDCSS